MLYNEEITELVKEIRVHKTEIEYRESEISSLREKTEKLLIERGESWKDEQGYAMIVGAGERVSYDTKALDELVLSDPEKYGWLHDYRRKSITAASLKIK